jgi:biopolymer transport protein ExbD
VVNDEGVAEREVMLQADRKVPYSLISKIMRTCMETEYSKIAFAVLRTTEDSLNE